MAIDLKSLFETRNAADYDLSASKCLLIGPPGSGKTWSFRTLPDQEHTLIINCEGGMLTLRGVHMQYVSVTEWDVLCAVIEKVVSNIDHVKNLCIDSLTEVNELAKDKIIDSRKQIGPETLTMQEYGILDKMMRGFIRVIRNIECNVICTALPKRKEDGETGEVRYYACLNGQLGENVNQFFDFVFFSNVKKTKTESTYKWLTGGSDKYQVKDRSGVLPAILDPNWSKVFDLARGKKE